MTDMMSTLKGFLGDDAENKIKNAMDMLSKSGALDNKAEENSEAEENREEVRDVAPAGNSGGYPTITPENLEIISQLKNMADRISNTNDSRSNLLRSLKPFLKTERQKSIDKAIRIINIGRFSGLFGGR